jgi:hypothetical protein
LWQNVAVGVRALTTKTSAGGAVALAALLLVAAPARSFAQSKTYTNADLGHPLSASRPTPSADELRALSEHQFNAPGEYADSTVSIAGAFAHMDAASSSEAAPDSSSNVWLAPYGYGGFGAGRPRLSGPMGPGRRPSGTGRTTSRMRR